MRIVAALALALGASCPSYAADAASGNWWLKTCTSTKEYNDNYCIGLVFGMNQINEFQRNFGDGRHYCLPDGVTMQQLRLVLVKYLQENPQVLHYSIGTLFMLAANKQFPCTQAATQ